MKFIFVFLVSFAVLPVYGSDDIAYQMLEHRILKLKEERGKKQQELDECRGVKNKLKIATGVTTLATGVGVVANVALQKKVDEAKKSVGSVSVVANIKDSRSQQQKDCASCNEFVQMGMSADEVRSIEGCENC